MDPALICLSSKTVNLNICLRSVFLRVRVWVKKKGRIKNPGGGADIFVDQQVQSDSFTQNTSLVFLHCGKKGSFKVGRPLQCADLTFGITIWRSAPNYSLQTILSSQINPINRRTEWRSFVWLSLHSWVSDITTWLSSFWSAAQTRNDAAWISQSSSGLVSVTHGFVIRGARGGKKNSLLDSRVQQQQQRQQQVVLPRWSRTLAFKALFKVD